MDELIKLFLMKNHIDPLSVKCVELHYFATPKLMNNDTHFLFDHCNSLPSDITVSFRDGTIKMYELLTLDEYKYL